MNDSPSTRPSMLGSAPRPGHMSALASLDGAVSVQPESTVSRTVMKAEGVRIVMFAFDTGQVLTEHTAAMPVLISVISGALDITADGRTERLVPGGVIHLETRVPHAVEALEPTIMALTMLDAR